ncbi:DUF4250 domain-containing protein [Fusibacter ferrireducens]|uniref:DUF4250 domain-containing protein n=1 Tax=Fusibacter ferrireducens TaxID=2785058 RepID=A0ABR9ZZ42_9FIRM|nr:DUF4250 domain-containing protein [Fusibacter ferrireducens]MBF4695725.1 DUF4250 domain-containing protein [Fusibacter ferrireducens]
MIFKLPEDPDICVSVINMKLRDQYASLDQLCDDLELDCDRLITTLKDHSFYYDPLTNQFKSI